MSEIREDIVTGKKVIIATRRGKRPSDFSSTEETGNNRPCPFCYGNEKLTPPEITALRPEKTSPDEPGWQVRVVPNKFAAVQRDEPLQKMQKGLFTSYSGKGEAEVIIESPQHDSTLGNLSRKQIKDLLFILRERFLELSRRDYTKYVQVFKNSGAVAGASLQHSHWQIISIPFVPTTLEDEYRGARAFFKKNRQCVFCTMIEEETQQKLRIVGENNDFIAFCPYASRYPSEIWILPRRHYSNFGKLPAESLKNLGILLKETISRLEKGFNYPPYNIILHSSPGDKKDNQFYHWHLEILPRLSISAGFELGTGCYINVTSPESAADFLRTIQ